MIGKLVRFVKWYGVLGNRKKFEDRFKERETEKIIHKNMTIMYINYPQW